MGIGDFPKGIFFLIGNEFCERFNYFALRALLSSYLTDILLYDERHSIIIYHLYAMAVYFLPLAGAIMSDSFLGKYKTILYVSMIYVIGNIIMGLSAIKPLNLPARELSLVGLSIIAIGTGGIKPCVAAFGGDQFDVPQQQHQLDMFFRVFYFTINAGSLLSLLIIPLVYKEIHCFDEATCYPLAFLLPAILMAISIIIFWMGRSLYRVFPPEGNMLIKVSACIGTAVWKKITTKGVKKDHWLDFATEKYGEKLVDEIKVILGILFLYQPLFVFFTLLEQQASEWMYQAKHLNGEIGSLFTIFPEQMQFVNPALILIFIPLFNYVIYPLFDKCNILTTPLQRMTAGGVLAGVAYIFTGLVSLGIEHYSTPLNKPNTTACNLLAVFVYGCKMDVQLPLIGRERFFEVQPLSMLSVTITDPDVEGERVAFDFATVDPHCTVIHGFDSGAKVKMGQTLICFSYKTRVVDTLTSPVGFCEFVDFEESRNSNPLVRTIVNINDELLTPTIVRFFDYKGNMYRQLMSDDTSANYMYPGTYGVEFGTSLRYEVQLSMGGVYVLGVIPRKGKDFNVRAITVVEPYKLHILIVLPQYIILTLAEVMFSVTGMEFSYEEAPNSMKSLVQGMWYFSYGFGQLFMIIVEYVDFFKKKSSTFFFFACLMFVDMIVFMMFARCYKYVNYGKGSSDEQ